MNENPVILVTGSNGQLGWEIRQLAVSFPQFHFVFLERNELDLSVPESIHKVLDHYSPSFIINAAAYTAVDKAEAEKELSLTINAAAVGKIAEWCEKKNATLIQISTDYVFNGKADEPYAVDHATDPVNHYGATKLEGEKAALQNCSRTIIIRTSWVYSEHGKNFVKTMLRLMKEKEQISVVNDQQGSPTYAADLAQAILQIVSSDKERYGIYHYSNEGIITWFQFAEAIKNIMGFACKIIPITTEQFPTPAKRPRYSAMDLQKIQKQLGVKVVDWRTSLTRCLQKLQAP